MFQDLGYWLVRRYYYREVENSVLTNKNSFRKFSNYLLPFLLPYHVQTTSYRYTANKHVDDRWMLLQKYKSATKCMLLSCWQHKNAVHKKYIQSQPLLLSFHCRWNKLYISCGNNLIESRTISYVYYMFRCKKKAWKNT